MGDVSPEKIKEGKRFREILAILRKHQFAQGLTPDKLRAIFEDLGPTFVKFGQILSMRSDILPDEYCRALEGLRTDVTPLPYERVCSIVSEVYGKPWQQVFESIDPVPLGSASIAQVHAATLLDGTNVVIKVQRPDIRPTMERDIKLMKRASGIVKYTPIGSALDFGMVLDEMYRALNDELDFDMEVRNLEEFRTANRDVAYVGCPEVFEELCSDRIIVMEHIGGWQVDDAEGLKAAGYDLDEIAVKLVNNYIKQIVVDRFFHADPHPGNIRISDGKIIWLDLGMMGRLSKREAGLYMDIITSIYENDASALADTLLGMCKCEKPVDKQAFTSEVDGLLTKYKAMSMADINISSVITEVVEILNRSGVSIPSSLTMLGRSLLVIQGMLAGVSPRYKRGADSGRLCRGRNVESGVCPQTAEDGGQKSAGLRRQAHRAPLSGLGISQEGQRRAAFGECKALQFRERGRRTAGAFVAADAVFSGLCADNWRGSFLPRAAAAFSGAPLAGNGVPCRSHCPGRGADN
jgi:ubiquinone biosynthesis protein